MSDTCRTDCGACCIAPSINSPIPGMPFGKPAGVRCVQLTADNRCAIFGRPERPLFCATLMPAEDLCGTDAADALRLIGEMERATRPSAC
jgi:Fe-S-cluster containining protein